MRPPYRIVSGQSDKWRLLFFGRLAIELLTANSQAADGAGFQLFASRSKKQIPIILPENEATIMGNPDKLLEETVGFTGSILFFEYGVPGLVLGAIRNGETAVAGFAEGSGKKPDGDTMMRIGSISKVFTG